MRIVWMSMVLAGDIGGTSTRLGVFEAMARPRTVVMHVHETLAYSSLARMVAEFLGEKRVQGVAIDRACFGVAGPVVEGSAELTNVPWRVDAREVMAAFKWPSVVLLNDLQAMA